MFIPPQPGEIATGRNIAADLLFAPIYSSTKNPQHSVTSGWSSIIGIVTAIVGNVLISFALNTQRYAHLRLERDFKESQKSRLNSRSSSYGTLRQANGADHDSSGSNKLKDTANGQNRDSDEFTETDGLLPSNKKDDDAEDHSVSSNTSEKRKSYLRSPYWWLGIILMTIGEAGNFLAYGFAPASIVSPLGVVALISNCLIAPIMLHERFRKRDLLGVVIAVGGAVTVVLSAEGSNPKLGPDEIYSLVVRWEFLTYLGICLLLIVVLMIASNRYGDKTIAIDIGLVGLFGGYTALSTKGVASLLSYKIWHVVTYPITYILVLVLVVTAVMQIKYVNRALQRFDSTQVIPTQFVTFTIFVILGSAILYRDFEKATPANIAEFIGGCALTFLGVWIITSGRQHKDDDDDDNEDEEDDPQAELKSARAAAELAREERNHQPIMLTDNDPPSPPTPSTPKPPPFLRSISSPSDSPASFVTATSRAAVTTPRAKPRFSASTSTPVLPAPAIAVQTPDTNATTILSSSYPHTNGDDPFITPSTTAQHPRHLQPTPDPVSPHQRFLLNRGSFSELLPKPLTSPLSSSFSVVVADAQRRARRIRDGTLRRTSSKNQRRRTSSNAAMLAERLLDEGNETETDDGTISAGPSRTVSNVSRPPSSPAWPK